MHPLLNTDHIVIMTGRPEDDDGVRTFFTLKRDPDSALAPHYLLYPLGQELPAASVRYDGQDWVLHPAGEADEEFGDDLLTLAAGWVADRYGLPGPDPLLSGD
ncbi:hypothetical protein ACSNOI_13370 [Actinomadura kijaniata]|uniref:hypothetical protein n=1 Tax=Actinomadura kijaniata TaxID=46161 RepID=UPI003F1DF18A